MGGDYETADLFADGAGIAPAAFARVVGDSVSRAVVITARPDAESVLLVHEDTRFGERMRVLGARLLARGDTIRVGGPAGVALTVTSVAAVFHRVDRVWSGAHWVALPAARRNWRDRLFSRHPGPLQRTYPLADVMEALGEPGASELSSFFFYDEGRVGFADLDSEVTLRGAPCPTPTPCGPRQGARAASPWRGFPSVTTWRWISPSRNDTASVRCAPAGSR